MKNNTILLFAFFFSAGLMAQTPYHPMLVEGRSWDLFTGAIEQSICPYVYAKTLVLNGDTTIDGTTYSKLAYYQILSNPAIPFCTGLYRDTTEAYPYYAFYREDTLARKVFMKIPDVPEFALFDFSLQTGDTLFYPSQFFPIEEVFDLVLSNGEQRKAFRISNWQNNYYVEGVGYLLGAFDPVFHPFEGWDVTTCVRDGEKVLYSDESAGGPGCVFATSGTQSPDFAGLEITPNPFTDQLMMKMPDHSPAEGFSFGLFDVTGRKVLQREMGATTDALRIDLPDLPQGAYFWAVNGVFGGRLIKN